MMMQKKGDECISFSDSSIGYTIQDFWSWNMSDLLNNTMRGAYCEFIVSAALDVDLSGTNNDWTPYDILFNADGNPVRIEVKSASYLQAWEQSKLSSIQFSIRPTRAWQQDIGYSNEVIRQSDVYVFCLYRETNRKKANPLVLDDWDFYVISTKYLNEKCGTQKSISLSSLMKLSPMKADYKSLRDAVINAAYSD